jgi:predicted RNA methylase
MALDARLVRLRRSIEAGELVTDRDFDALYPPRVRRLSLTFWTPVRVAQRAALLLAPTPGTRVLDVGAGVGKLCIIAAAGTRASVTGVEHREHLVRIARDAADRIGVHPRFIQGDLASVDWRRFDSFYFYNPFYENVHRDGARIDDAVELSQRRFLSDLRTAVDSMVDAPDGTRVVTYHGLGAELPAGYRLDSTEYIGTDALRLWIKDPLAARRALRLAASGPPPREGQP